ncbi:MAG: hypothetical protein KC766_30590 [Myxococcales bacterium]|nr:hypothetical protein [Myxococcales bacterium]
MLSWVTCKGLRGASWGLGLATCLGVFAAWVRLLPWMFASDVPWRVIWPFARILLASGLELALLIGAPVGSLVAWSLAAERGEVRGLLALGVAPSRLLARSLLPLGGVALLGAVAAKQLSGPVQGAPAQALSQLISAAEAHCAQDPEGIVDVPVAGMVQDCSSGRSLGRIPGAPPGWFAVSRLRTPTPSRLELGPSQFLLQGRRPGHWLRLDVGRARVRGFVAPPAAGRSWLRALAVALAVCCLGGLSYPLLRQGSPTRSLVFCVVGAVGAVLVLEQLDRLAVPSGAYGLLSVPPLICWGLATLLARPRLAQ